MRFTRFSLEGVKGFDSTQSVETRGLCLIFGGNSSGKSSIIQSLMMLKQSSAQQISADSRSLDFRGAVVDLGGFRTQVHNHDASRVMRFVLDMSAVTTRGLFNRSIRMSLGFALQATDQTDPVLAEFALDDGSVVSFARDRKHVLRLSSMGAARDLIGRYRESPGEAERWQGAPHVPSDEDYEWLSKWLYKKELRTSFNWIPFWWPGDVTSQTGRPLGGRRGSIREEMAQAFVYTWYTFSQNLAAQLRQAFAKVSYVAPIREFPKRVVTEAGSGSGLGVRGERLVLHLARNPKLVESVNSAFDRLELDYSLRVTRLEDPATQDALGEVAVALLVDRSTDVALSPADVGFGVSQVLPVIVQLLGNSQSTIVIEQPEIHLHPRMQSRLADIIIESVVQLRNYVVIETHSEHLLTRIQRRIRERSYSPGPSYPLSIYYVSNERGRSTVQNIRIDRLGRMVDPWPDDFMDERLDDLFASL